MPVVRHVRSGDLGAKVQLLHDLPTRRDDWHALLPLIRRGPWLLEATPPTRLPGLPAGKFALLKRHKTC